MLVDFVRFCRSLIFPVPIGEIVLVFGEESVRWEDGCVPVCDNSKAWMEDEQCAVFCMVWILECKH